MHVYMYIYIHTYIYRYIYIYIYIHIHIYTIFANAIPAAPRPPARPDFAQCSAPIKIAQTLARQWFWIFLEPKSSSILDHQIDQFSMLFIIFGPKSLNLNFRQKCSS